jgi:hypothetical protein
MVQNIGAQDQGAPLPTAQDQGAPLPAAYNLRPREGPTRQNVRNAMDAPHNGKSYYPTVQLLQEALNKAPNSTLEAKRRLVFKFILAHLATTCTQMSERAGLR